MSVWLTGTMGIKKKDVPIYLDLINDELISESRAKDSRRDFDMIIRQLAGPVVELRKKLSVLPKQKQRNDTLENLRKAMQLRFVENLSFVDAILLLPEFQHFVLSLRRSLGIQPQKLQRQLGFSEEELALATYSAKPAQMEAALIQLGRTEELKKRRMLRKRKLDFELSVLARNIRRKKRDMASKPKLISSEKQHGWPSLWIPKSQSDHVMNFVFYGANTGRLISLSGLEGNFGREWRNRLTKDKRGKGYIPFLMYYLYYFYRIVKKDDIVTVNNILQDLGFPPVERNHRPLIEKRYKDYFLKQ